VFGCKKYPRLRIRDVQFDNSVLEVYTEADAELVREADGFGQYIEELEVGVRHDIQPENPVGRARAGMRSAGDPDELPQENDAPPNPATEIPEIVFPETQWPQDADVSPEDVVGPSVLAKPGGWFEYEGKNYRKADLPPEARDLV
jgi:hypothetical protein